MPVSTAPYQYRPVTGQLVTVGVALVSAATLVAVAWQFGVADGLRALPWLGLVVGVCWAFLWRPHVRVDDGGVTVVNVARTIRLPWPAIQAIDTKWALTLITAYGRFTAFAAPAPGVIGTLRGHRSEARHLPGSTYGPEGIRPGDLPSTASGETALLIRERLEQLGAAGHLDDPRLEHVRAPVSWHLPTLLVGAALLLVALATLAV